MRGGTIYSSQTVPHVTSVLVDVGCVEVFRYLRKPWGWSGDKNKGTSLFLGLRNPTKRQLDTQHGSTTKRSYCNWINTPQEHRWTE